jgi:hypothetical protein
MGMNRVDAARNEADPRRQAHARTRRRCLARCTALLDRIGPTPHAPSPRSIKASTPPGRTRYAVATRHAKEDAMTDHTFDAIVIGAGQAGPAIAARCSKEGL